MPISRTETDLRGVTVSTLVFGLAVAWGSLIILCYTFTSTSTIEKLGGGWLLRASPYSSEICTDILPVFLLSGLLAVLPHLLQVGQRRVARRVRMPSLSRRRKAVAGVRAIARRVSLKDLYRPTHFIKLGCPYVNNCSLFALVLDQ